MPRWAFDVHPDDRAAWLDMTGRDETRTDLPLLRNPAHMLEAAKRNNLRVTAYEIPEEES